MLRALVLVLIGANLLFFAFTRGWFDGVFGLSSIGVREPGRLAGQFRPEAITLWPARPPSAPAVAGACYEAGPFVTVDAVKVDAILRGSLPPGSWTAVRSDNTVGSQVVTTQMFRVPAADPSLVARLSDLRLDPNGRGFSPCSEPARPR